MNTVATQQNDVTKTVLSERDRLIEAGLAAAGLGGPTHERAFRKVLALGRPSGSPHLLSETIVRRDRMQEISLDAIDRGVVLVLMHVRHIKIDMSEEIVWRDADLRGEPLCLRTYVPDEWQPRNIGVFQAPLRMDYLAEAMKSAVFKGALTHLECRLAALGGDLDAHEALGAVVAALTMLS